MRKTLMLVLRVIAVLLLAVAGLFFLFFGVGESLGGEPGGWIHLLPAVLLLGCLPLGWKRPLAAGIVLLLLGLVMGFRLEYALFVPMPRLPHFQPVLGMPFLATGFLFLIVGLLAAKPQDSTK